MANRSGYFRSCAARALLQSTRAAMGLSALFFVAQDPALADPMIHIAGDPVTIKEGLVAGTLRPSGVKAYLGIPYAKPPVLDLRWQAPQPTSWKGVWNADRKAPECIQLLRRHDINHYFGEEPTAEDCLYLNVWSPATAKAGAKLPVIVFIYGGGGTVGSSGMAHYDGEDIARHGAIFVSMNYRMGIFGFMAHPELSQQQGGHSGNYGYLDQNAALKWVQRNIAAFGGDPDKVLLTGQSFGAGSVSAQMVSPLSKGLFRAAMMSSSCNLTRAVTPLADAEKTGLDVQKRLGASNLADMRNAPADKILGLQAENQNLNAVAGVSMPRLANDGLFLTGALRDMLISGKGSAVPIIGNFNADDIDGSRYALVRAHSVTDYRSLAQKMYGANADDFLKLFPVSSDADVQPAAHEAATEAGFMEDTRQCALLNEKYNHQASYMDLFSQRHAYAPGVVIADQDVATVGAYHNADIPYWFGTLDSFNLIRPTRDWTAADHALSDRMMQTLVAFARTGRPTIPGASWPEWTSAAPQYVVLDDKAAAVRSMDQTRMAWLAAHPAAFVKDDGPQVQHAHD